MARAQNETTRDEHVAPPEAWDAIAALYDEHVAPGEVDLATTGLRLAGLQAGDTFLDVAAGTGGLSLPAARLGAKVLATDWSTKMIEHFTKRAAAEGLDAEGRVMNAHALDLRDDSYDVVGSQFGVMLVPDQPTALREMVRVAKPGGRVLLIAYGNPEHFEAFHFFLGAIQAVVPDFEGPPEDEPMLEFQVADPDELRRRLNDAGLRNVIVDSSHEERIEVRSGEQLWHWTIGSNPIPGQLLAGLTAEQRTDVIRVLDGMIRERCRRQRAGCPQGAAEHRSRDEIGAESAAGPRSTRSGLHPRSEGAGRGGGRGTATNTETK